MSLKAEQIFLALRSRMQARKITYRALAKRLGSSESAIKSLFHSESVSLDRLLEICEALDWNLAELTNAARIIVPGDFLLSDEQEDFFVKNRDHFLFFDALVLQGQTISEIQSAHGLDDLSRDRYLADLEAIGVIAFNSDGGVRALKKGRLKWRTGGPWYRAHFEKILCETARGFAAGKEDPSRYISFGAFSLPQPELLQLYRELDGLLDRYKTMAYVNSLGGKDPGNFVGFSFMVAPGPAPLEKERISPLRQRKAQRSEPR